MAAYTGQSDQSQWNDWDETTVAALVEYGDYPSDAWVDEYNAQYFGGERAIEYYGLTNTHHG